MTKQNSILIIYNLLNSFKTGQKLARSFIVRTAHCINSLGCVSMLCLRFYALSALLRPCRIICDVYYSNNAFYFASSQNCCNAIIGGGLLADMKKYSNLSGNYHFGVEANQADLTFMYKKKNYHFEYT